MDTSLFNNFHLKFNKELSEIYISVIIRSLAISLIAIFIPIYFYADLGHSIQYIIIFYILFYFFLMLFSPFAAHLSSKIGFKHNILLSTVFYIATFLMLNMLKTFDNIYFFFSIPLIFGLANALYWVSFHTNFAKNSKKKHRGEQMAFLTILSGIPTVIGPIAAGLILKFFSFSVLFIIGIIIFMTSTIPLFFSRDHHPKSKFSYKYIFQKKHLAEGTSFAVAGAKQMTLVVLWPLFIFIIIAEYLKFGTVMTILGAISLVIAWSVGKASDKFRKRDMLRVGSIIHLLVSFVMGFVKTIIGIVGVGTFASLGIHMTELTTTKKAYERGKKIKNLAGYIAYREVLVNIGRILLLLFFLSILFISQDVKTTFTIVFIIAGLTGFIHIIKPKF